MLKCATLFKEEVVIPLPVCCKNLWNMFALQFYDKDLFNKFGDIVGKQSEELHEKEMVTVFRSFAYFKHTNQP